MNEVIIASTLLQLFWVAVSIFIMVGLLRTYDKLNGVKFSESFSRISKDPCAAAFYYGMRFVGVCILLGLIVS